MFRRLHAQQQFRQHHAIHRSLRNYASYISSCRVNSTTDHIVRLKSGYILDGWLLFTCYCEITTLLVVSLVTAATSISIYQDQSSESDDTIQGTNDSSTTSSVAILATSPWRKPPVMSEQHTSQQDHLHAPIGTERMIYPNPYVQICYDTRTRNPIYVQYKLVVRPQQHQKQTSSNDNMNKNSNSNHHNTTTTTVTKRRQNYHFKEDISIEEPYRSRNSYYHNSGYDRGHLAPAADFHFNDDDNDSDMMKSTYNLCNISPQFPELNRILWNQLEQLIRQMAIKCYHEEDEAVTYVTTGPIYLPASQIDDKTYQYTMKGIGKPPSLIMVPTHFFKVVVVLDKTESNILYFACFVLPNDPSITETTKSKSLQSFVVPWVDLETVTGLTFYPDLVDDHWKVYADQITRKIQSPPTDTMSSQLMIEGSQQQQPYLTDGKCSNGSSIAHMKHQPQTSHEKLQHLCADQACLPRKQQSSRS